MFAGNGNDSVDGGTGNDRLFGNAGNDWLFGQAGDDVLSGSIGSDVLFGGDGADHLDGGADGDSLDGGDGNDVRDGGGGIDILFGGAGADEFRFSRIADGGDVVRDFVSGVDTIAISAADFGFAYSGALLQTNFSAGAGLPSKLWGTFGPHLYFDTENGGLWFDGTGGTTEDIVIVAGFETGFVTAADIWLV